MLNLNNIETGAPVGAPLELIPERTVVRAVINLLGGETELTEFGQGGLFVKSQTSSAIYCPLEFTIIGGDFNTRRVWHNLFVHGDKLDDNGVSVARNIGLSTLRRMIDSIHGLLSSDMSPEAQAKRNISGLMDLQSKEFCFSVGIEPEKNGYAAKNKMSLVLTPDNPEYVSGGGQPASAPPASSTVVPPAAVQNGGGVAPSWAQR